MLRLSGRVPDENDALSKIFAMRKPGMIDLSIGDLAETPERIKDAMHRAMKGKSVPYAPTLGNEDLRELISEKYRQECDVNSTKDNVIVSFGAKGTIYALMQCMIEKGDEVIVQDPGWFSYTQIVKLAGGTPVPADANTAQTFLQDVEEKITPRTKMVIFSNPSNPTGEVYGEGIVKRLAEIAVEQNILVVSDEPYYKIIFDANKHVSAGRFGLENIVVVNSFSKTYAMSGWRIGYAIAEKYIVEAMRKVQLHQSTAVPLFVQQAAKYALENDDKGVEQRRKTLEKRRNTFVNALSKRLRGNFPAATYYYFAKTGALGINGDQFAEKLARKNVLSVPGGVFGKCAPNAVRFSFAKKQSVLKSGAERINKVVEGL